MIDPTLLFALEPDTVVRTKDGDMVAGRVAARSYSLERDANRYRVNSAAGNVWIGVGDVRYVVDLTTDEYEPIDIGGGNTTSRPGP